MKSVRKIVTTVSKHLFVTKCVLVLSLLSACAPSNIYQDKRFNPPVYFGTHVVRQGETLYNIAWRYGRDYRELAATNNIKPPFILKIGQRINLELSDQARQAVSASSSSGATVSSNVTKRKPTSTSSNKSTKNKKSNVSNDITWRWPHLGLILAKYSFDARSRNINKGIDIGGTEGDEVLAAASGEVVYAGNGLLGYGNLIIINHSDRYLSAYGHNKTILVEEGEKVRIGQTIATMGNKGQKPTLHFEIRRDGRPVNPENYLPKR